MECRELLEAALRVASAAMLPAVVADASVGASAGYKCRHALGRAGKYDETIAVSRKLVGNSITDGSYRVRAELHHTARILSATAYKPARDFAAAVEHLVPA